MYLESSAGRPKVFRGRDGARSAPRARYDDDDDDESCGAALPPRPRATASSFFARRDDVIWGRRRIA